MQWWKRLPEGLLKDVVVVAVQLENDGRERHDDRHQPEEVLEGRDLDFFWPHDPVKSQRVCDPEGESDEATVQDLVDLEIYL